MSFDTVFHYYNTNYGKVTHVALFAEETHQFATVAFNSPAAARKVASTPTHVFASTTVTAKLAIATRKPIKLYTLNTDYMREIMREIMRYLNFKDLCSISSVCQRLKEIGGEFYSSKFSDGPLEITNVQDANDYLYSFGSNIKHLVMKNISFSKIDAIVADSPSLFAGLQKLVLNECSVSVKWFVKCRELRELALNDTTVSGEGVANQVCPNLKTLKIVETGPNDNMWPREELAKFIRQNNQLKALQLVSTFFEFELDEPEVRFGIPDHVINALPSSIEIMDIQPSYSTDLKRFVSLQRLRIGSDWSIISHLSDVPQLEYLEMDGIDYYYESHSSMVHSGNKLRALKFGSDREGFEDESYDTLLYFVENSLDLTHLELRLNRGMFTSNNLLEILQKGQNLQQVILSYVFADSDLQINEGTYQQMLNIITTRANKKPMHIVIFRAKKEHCFPKEYPLKITWLSIDFCRMLNINCDAMGNEDFKELRNRGIEIDPHFLFDEIYEL